MVESTRPKRVLVVDDEKIIAATLGIIFTQAGFASTSYNDPLDLLSACEIDAPDAVVSDVMMPHMTGIELALKLRELYPACKVILMSGQAATADLLQEATRQGHTFDVLGKPVPPAALIQHVRAALA